MSDENQMTLVQEASQTLEGYLHERGLRATPERYALLDVICSMDGHFSLEMLQEQVSKKHFSVSLATLYNNIDLFMDAGLICRHYIGPSVLFERRYGVEPHLHRICRMCGNVQDVRNDRCSNTICNMRLRGFTVDPSYIYLYGICSKCSAALRRKNKKIKK